MIVPLILTVIMFTWATWISFRCCAGYIGQMALAVAVYGLAMIVSLLAWVMYLAAVVLG